MIRKAVYVMFGLAVLAGTCVALIFLMFYLPEAWAMQKQAAQRAIEVRVVDRDSGAPISGARGTIDDHLTPRLIGRNPLEYRRLWRELAHNQSEPQPDRPPCGALLLRPRRGADAAAALPSVGRPLREGGL